MKYELIDCKPVPAALADEIRALKADTGAILSSALRNQAAVSYARSKGCSLSSQEELYNGWVARRPGYNPANPPGYSTHELRSDGVAYNIPRGLPLRYWMVGMDWTDSAAIVRAANKRGWIATITYPNNPRELHHVNFRKEPIIKLFNTLKRGDEGRRVKKLIGRLSFVEDPKKDKPYIAHPQGQKYFGQTVEDAVKRFQKDHHQTVDGIYGRKTHRQLLVAIRRQRRKN